MAHWHNSNGELGWPPVAEDVDEGLMAIRIAEVLNVAVTDVTKLAPHWIRNALIKIKIDALHHERAMKKATEQRKRATHPTTRRR